MNVSLTPDQEQRIQQQLHTGKYASATEVIDEALKLLEAKDHKPQRGKKIAEVFEQTGFIGCLNNADPSLSSNYKSIVRAEIGVQDDSC